MSSDHFTLLGVLVLLVLFMYSIYYFHKIERQRRSGNTRYKKDRFYRYFIKYLISDMPN